MSAVLEHLHTLLDEAKAEFAKLLGHGDAEVDAAAKAGAAKIDAAKAAVAAELPELEHDAVGDAEQVAETTETAAKPVENLAAQDAAAVAAEVKTDAEHAVQAGETADVAPAAASETAADETKPAVGA